MSQRDRAARELEAAAAKERSKVEARERTLNDVTQTLERERRELDERAAAAEQALETRAAQITDTETALKTREARLDVEAERLALERTDHGQASQDAFALLAELEARETRSRAGRQRSRRHRRACRPPPTRALLAATSRSGRTPSPHARPNWPCCSAASQLSPASRASPPR